MFPFARLVQTPQRQRELMEERDVGTSSSSAWGTCPKEKVAAFDGNGLGKGSFLKQVVRVDGWEQV